LVPETSSEPTSFDRCAPVASRAAFLRDPAHAVVVLYAPKHSSGLNQIEILLSILVRKLLKLGSFTSVEELQARVLAFIDYYNRTMAKPIEWTYTGMTPRRNRLDVGGQF